MTTIGHQPDRGCLPNDAAPRTVARLTGLDALSGPLTPVTLKARGTGPSWNCLGHVPGSIASWVAECGRFGGRRRRQEAAKATYDAIWAGHGIGERAHEPSPVPGGATEIDLLLQQTRRISAASGRPVGLGGRRTPSDRLWRDS
jgi:hypothetical protein